MPDFKTKIFMDSLVVTFWNSLIWINYLFYMVKRAETKIIPQVSTRVTSKMWHYEIMSKAI